MSPVIDRAFNWLEANFQPPAFVVQEAMQRGLLLLNHVLMQEPQATDRLRRHANRVVAFKWRSHEWRVRVTPAGLLDFADTAGDADLTLTLVQDSPSGLASSLQARQMPELRLNGDVQLAAEINWLVSHVRWDMEEDLSRLIGDAPAHAVMRALRFCTEILRQKVTAVGPRVAA